MSSFESPPHITVDETRDLRSASVSRLRFRKRKGKYHSGAHFIPKSPPAARRSSLRTQYSKPRTRSLSHYEKARRNKIWAKKPCRTCWKKGHQGSIEGQLCTKMKQMLVEFLQETPHVSDRFTWELLRLGRRWKCRIGLELQMLVARLGGPLKEVSWGKNRCRHCREKKSRMSRAQQQRVVRDHAVESEGEATSTEVERFGAEACAGEEWDEDLAGADDMESEESAGVISEKF